MKPLYKYLIIVLTVCFLVGCGKSDEKSSRKHASQSYNKFRIQRSSNVRLETKKLLLLLERVANRGVYSGVLKTDPSLRVFVSLGIIQEILSRAHYFPDSEQKNIMRKIWSAYDEIIDGLDYWGIRDEAVRVELGLARRLMEGFLMKEFSSVEGLVNEFFPIDLARATITEQCDHNRFLFERFVLYKLRNPYAALCWDDDDVPFWEDELLAFFLGFQMGNISYDQKLLAKLWNFKLFSSSNLFSLLSIDDSLFLFPSFLGFPKNIEKEIMSSLLEKGEFSDSVYGEESKRKLVMLILGARGLKKGALNIATNISLSPLESLSMRKIALISLGLSGNEKASIVLTEILKRHFKILEETKDALQYGYNPSCVGRFSIFRQIHMMNMYALYGLLFLGKDSEALPLLDKYFDIIQGMETSVYVYVDILNFVALCASLSDSFNYKKYWDFLVQKMSVAEEYKIYILSFLDPSGKYFYEFFCNSLGSLRKKRSLYYKDFIVDSLKIRPSGQIDTVYSLLTSYLKQSHLITILFLLENYKEAAVDYVVTYINSPKVSDSDKLRVLRLLSRLDITLPLNKIEQNQLVKLKIKAKSKEENYSAFLDVFVSFLVAEDRKLAIEFFEKELSYDCADAHLIYLVRKFGIAELKDQLYKMLLQGNCSDLQRANIILALLKFEDPRVIPYVNDILFDRKFEFLKRSRYFTPEIILDLQDSTFVRKLAEVVLRRTIQERHISVLWLEPILILKVFVTNNEDLFKEINLHSFWPLKRMKAIIAYRSGYFFSEKNEKNRQKFLFKIKRRIESDGVEKIPLKAIRVYFLEELSYPLFQLLREKSVVSSSYFEEILYTLAFLRDESLLSFLEENIEILLKRMQVYNNDDDDQILVKILYFLDAKDIALKLLAYPYKKGHVLALKALSFIRIHDKSFVSILEQFLWSKDNEDLALNVFDFNRLYSPSLERIVRYDESPWFVERAGFVLRHFNSKSARESLVIALNRPCIRRDDGPSVYALAYALFFQSPTRLELETFWSLLKFSWMLNSDIDRLSRIEQRLLYYLLSDKKERTLFLDFLSKKRNELNNRQILKALAILGVLPDKRARTVLIDFLGAINEKRSEIENLPVDLFKRLLCVRMFDEEVCGLILSLLDSLAHPDEIQDIFAYIWFDPDSDQFFRKLILEKKDMYSEKIIVPALDMLNFMKEKNRKFLLSLLRLKDDNPVLKKAVIHILCELLRSHAPKEKDFAKKVLSSIDDPSYREEIEKCLQKVDGK